MKRVSAFVSVFLCGSVAATVAVKSDHNEQARIIRAIDADGNGEVSASEWVVFESTFHCHARPGVYFDPFDFNCDFVVDRRDYELAFIVRQLYWRQRGKCSPSGTVS